MSKENCCCGCIHTGALIIGYLVSIFGIIVLLPFVVKVNGIGIVFSVLSVIIGGCILYADKSHKPGGYLPYLIFAVIGIVIYTVFIVLFVFLAIAETEAVLIYTEFMKVKDIEIVPKTVVDKYISYMRLIYLFAAAVMAFADGIAIWLWMVVYRAYEHMKNVKEYDRGQTYQVKINV